MSKCPYKNFKNKINKFIEILKIPREEFSGFAPCPFVASEVSQEKLMIDIFDPSKNSIIEMVEKLKNSKYESGLFAQVIQEDIPNSVTFQYQAFINKLLKDHGYTEYKCICINPKDNLNIEGFNIRSHAPYFLINIANKKILSKAHRKMVKTKYFDKMNKKYLDYLQIKENELRRKD